MPDALSSETIYLNIVQVYFEDDAFQHLNKLIQSKRHNNTNWTCYSCKNNLDTDDSVECDKCLFWNHWACVELTEAPLNDWFCPKCKLENNN
ncbi:Similar to TAF3: Transcription initiation factor TFIID subunit 3 (Homo sapiens) [Cotesia congregata]|uniref:Similar to TAF3: Transcription initiation factor TFIID subunit 3 (Homo sapiens) n=1 Tax=Cotesia congregata TaxID=51543 RepID=A0A8J2MPJ8_COTCN|nr:Similar to TAF3: Transcription initiation factor TFIID subunit 3 (Homo sapiens) [Cotesia congregata]